MIGGYRFALARAAASRSLLVTLAAVVFTAGALIAVVAGAIQTAQTTEVRAVLADAPGDTARLVLRDADPDAVEADVRAVLDGQGVADVVIVERDAENVTVAPDVSAISSTDLPPLIEAVSEMDADQVIGGLEATLSRVDAALVAHRGPAAVAAALIGVMAAVVVAAVGIDTVRVRREENHLLRARGARRRMLVGLAAGEAAVVAVVAAGLGTTAGALVVALTGESAGWMLLLVSAVALALVAVASVLVATLRGADRGSGRAATAVDIGALVVLAVVAGLAAWRFVEAGSPVVVRGDGSVVLDPLVALAPALVLLLAALVALAVAMPLARIVAAGFSRSRSVFPVTPLRFASRRPGRHALSIVTVSFAIGALTLASLFQATIAALGDAPEQLRVGADVRVGTIPADVDIADIEAIEPSDASMPVRPVVGRLDDGRVSVLAVSAASLGDVMSDPGGQIDPDALGATLSPGTFGEPIDGDTVTVAIHAESVSYLDQDGTEWESDPSAAQVRLTLLSASGSSTQLIASNYDAITTETSSGTFIEVDVRADDEVDLPLPSGGPWTLVAVDAAPAEYGGWAGPVTVTASDETGTIHLAAFEPAPGGPGTVTGAGEGLEFTVDVTQMDVPSRAIAPGVPSAIPAVVSTEVAESLRLAVGDDFSLELDSPDMGADFTVADIIPFAPGTATGQGILIDLSLLALLAPEPVVPNQLWMSSDSPIELADGVEAAFPQTVTVTADPDADRAALAAAAGFAIAALGAAALAVIVLVLRRTRSRADTRELAILAVLGLGRARAARVRVVEDVFAVVMGALGGLAAGAVTGWLVVPALVRGSFGGIPDSYPVPLRVDALALSLAVLVALAVFGAVVATVRAPASLAPILREDE